MILEKNEEKKIRYETINKLSNILWSKYQTSVNKYKKLSVTQMEYMSVELESTDKIITVIYSEALKMDEN